MNKTNVGASLDTIHFLIDIFMLIFSYSITVLIFFTQLNEVQIMQLLLICTIYSIKDEYNNYNSLQEADSFKYEVLQHQNSLINYQRNMIKELANYLQNEHNCDIPQFDGELKDNIQFDEEYIDSLYNTQL